MIFIYNLKIFLAEGSRSLFDNIVSRINQGHRENSRRKQGDQEVQQGPPAPAQGPPPSPQLPLAPQGSPFAQGAPGFPPRLGIQPSSGFPPRQGELASSGLPPRQGELAGSGVPPRQGELAGNGFPPRPFPEVPRFQDKQEFVADQFIPGAEQEGEEGVEQSRQSILQEQDRLR